MKTITHLLGRLAALTLTFAALSPAHAGDPDVDGALVGGSEFNLSLDGGLHSGKAVLAASQPRKDVSGYFGIARLNVGILMRATKFGSEAGLEGSLGLGLITSDAYGDSADTHFAADVSFGVVVVPLRLKALDGFAFKISGGVGTDYDVDYLYASARLGFGENPGGLGFELGYNYRVGDTPIGAQLNEHRFSATVLFDESHFLIGVSYDFGEASRYTSAGVEKTDPDTMRKGDYSDLIVSIGYVFD